MHSVYTSSELLRLREDRLLGLHPEQVGVGGKGNSAMYGALGTTLVPVVTLTSTGSVPVPVRHGLQAEVLLCDGDSLGVRELGHGMHELLGNGVASALLREGSSESLGEELEVGGGDPLVFDGLELLSALARGFRLHHHGVQGTELRVRGAENEGVVAVVDVGGDEGGGFRVGTGNDKVLDAHDVVLQTNGDETVDVLRDGNQDLASHMAALLGSRCLVLDVNTSSTLLDEHLGELHDSRKATMASIGISDDGTEVVDNGGGSELGIGHSGTTFALFSVVEQLGHEQVLDLVGDGVRRIIYGTPHRVKLPKRRSASKSTYQRDPGQAR